MKTVVHITRSITALVCIGCLGILFSCASARGSEPFRSTDNDETAFDFASSEHYEAVADLFTRDEYSEFMKTLLDAEHSVDLGDYEIYSVILVRRDIGDIGAQDIDTSMRAMFDQIDRARENPEGFDWRPLANDHTVDQIDEPYLRLLISGVDCQNGGEGCVENESYRADCDPRHTDPHILEASSCTMIQGQQYVGREEIAEFNRVSAAQQERFEAAALGSRDLVRTSSGAVVPLFSVPEEEQVMLLAGARARSLVGQFATAQAVVQMTGSQFGSGGVDNALNRNMDLYIKEKLYEAAGKAQEEAERNERHSQGLDTAPAYRGVRMGRPTGTSTTVPNQ